VVVVIFADFPEFLKRPKRDTREEHGGGQLARRQRSGSSCCDSRSENIRLPLCIRLICANFFTLISSSLLACRVIERKSACARARSQKHQRFRRIIIADWQKFDKNCQGTVSSISQLDGVKGNGGGTESGLGREASRRERREIKRTSSGIAG